MMFAALPLMILGFVQVRPLEVTGEAGFGGLYKPGAWTPVVLDLHNSGDTRDILIILTWGFRGTSQDGVPSPTSLRGRRGPFHHFQLVLPKASRKRFYATIPAPGSDLSVWAFVCRPDGAVLERRELGATALKSQERLIAVAGARPLGLELAQLKVAQVSPSALPEDWRGYDSIEALVWTQADPNLFQSATQVDALRKWISSGGRWIIDRSSADPLLQSPLAGLVPVAPGRPKEAGNLDSLGELIGADLKGPVILVEAQPARGAVLARQEGIPLVVDAVQDGGRVTFLAFDPNLAPFTTTEAGRSLWTWLLDWVPPSADPMRSSTARAAVGSEELLSLLASFPGVAVPELRRLFLFIFIFLAVAGPVDYLVLRRLRRLRLTWITFPSYIVILTVSIVVAGAGFMRNLVMQREIAVVDHYEGSKFMRRRALEAILTPSDMTLASKDALPLTSDFLFRRSLSELPDLSDLTFRWDRGMSYRDWTIPRGATAMALADECFESPSRLTWRLDSPVPYEVAFAIRNDLGVELSRATLHTPGGVYYLGDLPAGESRRVPAPMPAWDSRVSYGREEDHSARIQLHLEALSFPAGRAEWITGFSADLEANRWIRAGGSVLLAWSVKLDPPVTFDPAPAHKRSLVLHRFFQEPRP